MPNNWAPILTRIRATSWDKTSASRVQESSAPPYNELDEERIREALDTLQDRLSAQRVFSMMPLGDLRSVLRRLVLLQRAIVRALQIVGDSASEVLRILVDREAELEQREEDLARDDVVDAGHGVDDGENYDYDGNLD